MQNEVTNEPANLRSSADDLHDEARKIVLATAIKYGLITFVVGGILLLISAYAAGFTISVDDPNVDGLIVMLLTVIGGAIVLGVENGRRKAFHFELAQRIVYRIQAEMNAHTSENTKNRCQTTPL
jgi:hypothetical protein